MHTIYHTLKAKFGTRPPGRLMAIDSVIKVLILSLLAWGIYSQVIEKADRWDWSWQSATNLNFSFLVGISLVALLMPLNWGLEALKWRCLMRKVENGYSLQRSWKSVLAGTTAGMLTPYRFGEFAGKLLFVQPSNRSKALLMTAVGSTIQLTVICSMGALGFLVHRDKLLGIVPGLSPAFAPTPLIASALCFISIGLLAGVFSMHLKLPFHPKITMLLKALQRFNRLDISKLVLISITRYSVYAIQYVLLLQIFGIQLAFVGLMMIVAVIFLAQTALPSLSILDIGIKGSIAVLLLQPFTVNAVGIIAAATTLWVINLVIPSLIGYRYIQKERLLN